MFEIEDEKAWQVPQREDLLDLAFGPARFEKPSERLREGRLPEIALSAMDGDELLASVRLWRTRTADGRLLLLLGPLAVVPRLRGTGVGGRLMRAALNRAAVLGHAAVLLVGDAAYYGRFGFSAQKSAALRMPGTYDQSRLLALELLDGALDDASGMVLAAAPVDAAPWGVQHQHDVRLGPWPPLR